jgi:hypothetical protein
MIIAKRRPRVTRVNVALSGAINGINQFFTTATPFLIQDAQPMLTVVFNGVRLTYLDDYTISEGGGVGTGFNQVYLFLTPLVGDHVRADYTED